MFSFVQVRVSDWLLVILPSFIPKLQHAPLPPKCCEQRSMPKLLTLLLFSPQIHIWIYQGAWEYITWYQSSSRTWSTYWGILMALKRTHKLVQETMVEKPTHDLDVPYEAVREEEQKGFRKTRKSGESRWSWKWKWATNHHPRILVMNWGYKNITSTMKN